MTRHILRLFVASPSRTGRSPIPAGVRKPDAFGVALALGLALTVAGCGGGSVETDDTPVVAAPTDPDVVAVVRVGERTLEIREADLARSEEFHRRAYPDAAEHVNLDRVLNNDLIPHAAARIHYADKIPVLMTEIDFFLEKFRDGGRFESLQQAWRFQDSDHRRSSMRWWALDEFRFSVQGLAAFDTPIGDVAEPFVTLVGLHLLYVQDRVESGAVERPTAKVIEMIAQFEKTADVRTAPVELLRNTKVDWIREEYRPYVNTAFLF